MRKLAPHTTSDNGSHEVIHIGRQKPIKVLRKLPFRSVTVSSINTQLRALRKPFRSFKEQFLDLHLSSQSPEILNRRKSRRYKIDEDNFKMHILSRAETAKLIQYAEDVGL